MQRHRFLTAAALAGSLRMVAAVIADPASADSDKQKGKGGNAPEVPATAKLPVAAAVGGAAYYVIARRRRHVAVAAVESTAE
jgi:hypothetical protein